MRGRNKKLVEEMEIEVAELIAISGQRVQQILTDFNDYCALKKRSNTLGSILNDCDIWQMKDLHPAFLLGMLTEKKQGKIQAA